MNRHIKHCFQQLILLMLASVVFVGISFAQEHTESKQNTLSAFWSLKLGNRTGISFEHPLGRHFLMSYSTGIMLNHRFQPYGSHKGIALASEYTGFSPFISADFSWYPSPQKNNTGFYIGLGFNFLYHKAKFGISEEKDTYKLEQEDLLMTSFGYKYSIRENLNLNFSLNPTFGMGFAENYTTNYGTLDLRWNLGLSYLF